MDRAPLAELDDLLARARDPGLSFAEAHRAVDLLDRVPGRARAVARALDDRLDPPHLDALWRLDPSLPGVVEGTYRALRSGACRHWPAHEDAPATRSPRTLALEFPQSRARRFPELLDRAVTLGAAPAIELDQLAPPSTRRAVFRLAVSGRGIAPPRADLVWLHGALDRLKGLRLWLNGWVVTGDGPWPLRTRALLIEAWCDAASSAVPDSGR